MTFANPWFVLAIIGCLGLYHLELFATLLNMSALKTEVPEPLADSVTEEEHERALEYARVSAKFDILQSSVSLALFGAFWWGGGFAFVDAWLRGFHFEPITNGLCVIGLLFTLQSLASLPFDHYDTFGIEREFGFNKMTVGTFIMDRLKGLLLGVILGLPLLALVLWLFEKFSLAAFYSWLVLSAFSLLMTWLAPRLILPLFYKFEPMKDEALRAAIVNLSQKLAFPIGDVSVVDGSRRSTKGNAFFTGFGATKRIALFDTLIANHSQDEILAVLAHEIGHCKRGHVPKQIIQSLAVSGIMFALLHFALHDPRLSAAFGITHHSIAWGLVFFSIIYSPLSMVLGLISGHTSRKNEFEADAFAKEAMGSESSMVSALTKLSKDHLSNPTPHPFYVFLHYSHPPMLERVAALRA